jgi:hypothetical protein
VHRNHLGSIAFSRGAFNGVVLWDLIRTGTGEAVLVGQDRGIRAVRRLNYLRDPLFAGLFDPNPRFGLRNSCQEHGEGYPADPGLRP